MIAERKFLKDALYEWIASVVSDNGRTDEVIWDNGKGVRPVPPFIALQFIGGSRPGLPSYGNVKLDGSENGEQRIYVPSKKTVTLHGIGEGAFDLLQTICDSIFMNKYISFLKSKNLVINKLSDVTETGNEMDTEMENHAIFDIMVSFMRVVIDRPGWIENVEITSENLPSISPIEI
jgi:hypothetical protein